MSRIYKSLSEYFRHALSTSAWPQPYARSTTFVFPSV
jgi:hypothetical protein